MPIKVGETLMFLSGSFPRLRAANTAVFFVFFDCVDLFAGFDSLKSCIGPSYYGNLDKHDIVEMTCFPSVSLGKELQRKSKQQNLNN